MTNNAIVAVVVLVLLVAAVQYHTVCWQDYLGERLSRWSRRLSHLNAGKPSRTYRQACGSS
jgi:hypothetical protein